jgi:pullulanase
MYFSRISDGVVSNGSGCGNDTASERSMVHKYIVDSVCYWADEYHIDGFRFDLVGLIDTQTINEIVAEVHKTHPNVIFYGEGWTMNTMVTKEGVDMCTQTNASLVPEFAFFSDTVRDALKGSVFENTEKGYVSGSTGFNKLLSKCFKGGPAWCPNPTQTINYVSCHDNNTLIDRITLSTAESSREDRVKMNNLAAAFCLTSQGVPFFQAGEEMLRTKPLPEGGFDHNSYASSDEVNSMKWETLDEAEVQTTYNYYKGLIAFRKAHPALRMTTKAEADANIAEVNSGNANVLAYTINGGVNGETAESILVAFNSSVNAHELKLPEGVWNIYVSGDKAGTEVLGTAEGTVSVDAISTVVLVKEAQEQPQPTEAPAGEQNDGKGVSPALLAGAAAVAAAAVAGAAVILKKRKK